MRQHHIFRNKHKKMDEEAKPTPKNSKFWMKLPNLSKNIAYEWM
jgi:hypothetical protein